MEPRFALLDARRHLSQRFTTVSRSAARVPRRAAASRGRGSGCYWTWAGSDAIGLGTRVLIGVAVSSHTTAAACEAVFESVAVR